MRVSESGVNVCVGLATNNRFYASHNHGAEIYGIHFPPVNFAFSFRPSATASFLSPSLPLVPLFVACASGFLSCAKHASCRSCMAVGLLCGKCAVVVGRRPGRFSWVFPRHGVVVEYETAAEYI